MSLRSVQFVRTVKLLTVRKEGFTVRKLHPLATLRIFSTVLVTCRGVQCLYGL